MAKDKKTNNRLQKNKTNQAYTDKKRHINLVVIKTHIIDDNDKEGTQRWQ